MSRLLAYREVILKTLEQLRGNKTIGKSLEAMVHLNVSEDDWDFSTDDREWLKEMVMVTDLDVHKGRDVVCQAEPTVWSRCDRFWRYTPDVVKWTPSSRQIFQLLSVRLIPPSDE